MHSDDTIVAVSSAVGPAARMIVRVSGPLAHSAAGALTGGAFARSGSEVDGRELQDHSAGGGAGGTGVFWGTLRFAELTCPAWIYRFDAPRSYTGEDLIEFHLPGNPVLVRLLLRELESCGLRKAEPGEFTARGYFNGRMDLTAAEGVAATIAAGSEQELAAARRLLAGELARRLTPAMDLLTGTLALLEVGIDFSDEDVTFLSAAELCGRVEEVSGQLRALLADSARFEELAHEPSFVLVGRPNAGKSSLLNALAGFERAVASPVAGTTRDALAVVVSLPRGNVRVIDVAGVEEGQSGGVAEWRGSGVDGRDAGSIKLSAVGQVQRQMRERALRAVGEADFVVLVRPCDATEAASVSGSPTDLAGLAGIPRRADLVVASKCDLAADLPEASSIPVSVVTGEGLWALRTALDGLAFGRSGSEARLALNLRHVHAIEHALESLGRAGELAGGAVELCAAELRDALDALGQVLGHVSPDDLIGRIFSQFCIGK